MRPATLAGDAVTGRGAALAAVLAAALLLLPGVRVWGFQPAQAPVGAAPYLVVQSTAVSLTSEPGNSNWLVTVTPPAPGRHDTRVEVWPARRDGFAIEPDPTASQQSLHQTQGGSICRPLKAPIRP